MAWIPPLTVASPPGADSLDALFATAGSSSDPAVEALDALGQSYADELSFLQTSLGQSQVVPSAGAYDVLGTLAGGTPAGGSSDPTTQLEQTLGGLLGGEDTSGESADEQLLDSALPATPLDLYA